MVETILKLLYFVGFVIQMYGGYLLYKHSYPPNIDAFGTFYLFDGITPEQQNKHDNYLRKSKLGFTLLLIGFIFQAPLNFVNCFPGITKIIPS